MCGGPLVWQLLQLPLATTARQPSMLWCHPVCSCHLGLRGLIRLPCSWEQLGMAAALVVLVVVLVVVVLCAGAAASVVGWVASVEALVVVCVSVVVVSVLSGRHAGG